MIKEEKVFFSGIAGFVIALIILTAISETIAQKQWKAKGCYHTTQQIGIYDHTGWQCKDGCFYYETRHNDIVCFKN